MTLTAERLRALLEYNPVTGDFTRLIDCGGRGSKSRVGAVAGRPHYRDGHVSIMIDRKSYGAHRLAFLWVTGDWPPGVVDHINRVPGDNRWANLRVATIAQNAANSRRTRKAKKDTDLPRGVYRLPSGNFQAQYGKGGYIGVFRTVGAASDAVIAAIRARGHEPFLPIGEAS